MTITVQDLAVKLAQACGVPLPEPAPAQPVVAAPAVPVAPAVPGGTATAPISTPAPAPAPAPAAPQAVNIVDYSLRGVHLDVTVPAGQVVTAAKVMLENGFAIDAVTGVDWLAASEMEVVYDYFHPETNFRVAVRSRLPRANPEIATISEVFAGANWHERETHDFFGINFLGHPDLSPLLLPDDATYHPLRKDFTA